MSRLAVFGYGSLVSPKSAGQTLGREVGNPQPARLAGYRRCWTLARDNHRSEKTFALADGTLPSYCVGLNLEPDTEGPAPNGALLELSVAELERLDLREIRYRRIDVTDAVAADGHGSFDAIYAYTARPAHHHLAPPPGAVLIASYLRAVEGAFGDLGPGELERFRATTAEPDVDVVEARLVRDAIPPGNPRAW
jgi:cation transport regulator ChaC